MTKRETDILAHSQVPHSVWENFVSFLFRKLSRQEKYFSHTECILSATRQCNSTLLRREKAESLGNSKNKIQNQLKNMNPPLISSLNELWIEKKKTREKGVGAISQAKCRMWKELARKQLMYRRTSNVTVPPYKQRALETLRRACSVSLMFSVHVLSPLWTPALWRIRSLSGMAAAHSLTPSSIDPLITSPCHPS